MTLVVTAMRVFTAPLSRNPDTGHFTVNMVVIVVALLAVALMAAFARLGDDRRVDIGRDMAVPFSAVTRAAGALIGITGAYDLLAWVTAGRVPPPQTAMASAVPVALLIITGVLAVASGVVLVLLSRQVSAERGTRTEMCTWEMLIPVLWVWFRLTRYLMSYASAVSLDECVYDFGMFVAELLFMFKLARFVSGIGRTTVSGMLAYALSASVWALSAALTRVCMYALGDTQAYLASRLAGFSDFAVGVLALVFAGGLWYSTHHPDPPEDEPEVSEDSSDSPFTVEGLILGTMDE